MTIETGKTVWHKLNHQEVIVVHEEVHQRDESQRYWLCQWQDSIGKFNKEIFAESVLTDEPPPKQGEFA